MAKIIEFPNSNDPNKRPIIYTPKPKRNWFKSAFFSFAYITKIILAIFWIPIKWILSMDCFFQLLRMLYYWNTPGIHAGWIFLAHFSVLTVLMIFITSTSLKKFSR